MKEEDGREEIINDHFKIKCQATPKEVEGGPKLTLLERIERGPGVELFMKN